MNGDVLQWENEEMTELEPMTNTPFFPLLCDTNTTVFLFFFKIHLNSGCVCCLASLGHIHTASVDPNPLLFLLLLLLSIPPANTVFKLLHQKNRDAHFGQHSAGELEARWCFTIQTSITSLTLCSSAQHSSSLSCVCVLCVHADCKQAQNNSSRARVKLCECGPQVFIHIYWCMFLWIPVLSLYYILYKTNDH